MHFGYGGDQKFKILCNLEGPSSDFSDTEFLKEYQAILDRNSKVEQHHHTYSDILVSISREITVTSRVPFNDIDFSFKDMSN